MKIIDLLNKIANKEDLPKKIRFKDVEYIKKEDNFNDISYYESTTSKYDLLTKRINTTVVLNDEVELIEDEKIDIQKVASIKYNFDKESYTVKDINEAFKTFVKLLGMQSDKINELVQAVKQLDKRTRKE